MSTRVKASHAELGAFLKAKRHQITPEQAGLPAGFRRRTPGLRREEVAQLAAVGQTWYTWLEQGRPITVSAQVLHGISRALQLSNIEKEHLFALAAVPLPKVSEPLITDAGPLAEALLTKLEIPAYLVNQRWDIIACNKAMQQMTGLSSEELAARPNMLRFLLLSPRMQQQVDNWERTVSNTVAIFRAATVKYVNEHWYQELIEDLQAASSLFKKAWADQSIALTHAQPRTLHHPELGRQQNNICFLSLLHDPGVQLIVHVPR